MCLASGRRDQGYRRPVAFPAVSPRVPLILDVDTGIDDSLALLYACASPEAELLAVTCCSGNVEAEQVVENTLAVLELADRDDVEVALGARCRWSVPSRRRPRPTDHGGSATRSCRRRDAPSERAHGADLIVETARRARAR